MDTWFNRLQRVAIRHLSKRKVIAVLVFVTLVLVSGLIENILLKWIMESLVPWLSQSSFVPHWLLLVLLFSLVLATVAAWRKIKADMRLDPRDAATLKYAAAYLYTHSFLELITSIDDDLRQSLEDRNQGAERSLSDFIDRLFVKTLAFLGPEVRTGVIYRPKENDSEWLAAWRANPGHYLTKKTFYIGGDEAKMKDRGCAGEVFISNKPIKYNIIDLETGAGDHPCKKVFKDYEKQIGGPDYLSSVVVPIHWNRKVVGVLSVDSKKRDFFLDEMVAIIQVIADRIGDALYLHGELEQQPL